MVQAFPMSEVISAHKIEEWSDFLRRVSIFSELEEESLKEVAKKLQPLSLPKAATLYHEGDAGDALYVIQSGRVRIVQEREEGKEKVLNYLGRGDTFGETALLTGAPRSVTAKVDSAANFLVLYKKDFEAFLKKNPTASFYLSRLISQRLLIAQKPASLPVFRSELLGFICDLEKEDQIVFLVNMAIALTEQTRRRTLLLELSPYGAELIQSLGMRPILSSARMLTAEDLRNTQILERLTLIHPSGLEMMTFSPETFTGNLFRALPSFLATLRDLYGFVIIALNPKSGSGGNSEGLNHVSISILQECDSNFYLFKEPAPNLKPVQDLLQENAEAEPPVSVLQVRSEGSAPEGKEQRAAPPAAAGMPQKLKTVHLRTRSPSLSVPIDFSVPWNDAILTCLKQNGRPYLTGPATEPTHQALNRIARAIGKLQVGLAMGSGAAYGYTLIGLLKVFEREKIPIDFVSGTSMGALIASFYASGKTAAEIEAIAYSITKVWMRKNFLSDLNLPWPHGGLLLGQTISKFLKGVLGETEFKDLKIPFACAATDIMSGDAVVLREGKVWEAVRASISLPLIYRPYKMGNRFFVDGGLVNPVPASIIASMGADILISVNLTGKVSERKVSLRRLGIFPSKTPGFFNIFFKMIYTMQYQIASARTDLSHIVIHPETRNFSWVDFHRAKQIVPLGEDAAEEALTKIKSCLPFFSDFCRVPIRPPRILKR